VGERKGKKGDGTNRHRKTIFPPSRGKNIEKGKKEKETDPLCKCFHPS